MPVTERTRPRDRKQRIEDAAAVAFAERGYHEVGMSDVAAAVGISAPALYRHFANKYELFVRAAFRVAHRLIEDTDELAAEQPQTRADAEGQLDRLLDAVIRTTIELRAVGGLFRWEGRYLESDDRARLTAEFDTLRQRFLAPLALVRPELDEADREQAVWAALSSVASITAHRTIVAAATIHDVLHAAAWRALRAELPELSVREAATPEPATSTRRRERIVTASIALFASRGYRVATIEEIAAAVDLTPSGVYRHFEGKSAILLEACERAAARLDEGARAARGAANDPEAALRLLAADYVHHSVENHLLMRVYFADVTSLAPDEQRRLRALQREYVAHWVELLMLARPELTAREATLLAHAAFGVVADLGILARLRRADISTRTTALVVAVLGIA